MRTLRKGSKGPSVLVLERALKEIGYFKGAPDETFDEETEKAVLSFQRDAGITVDGIVGRETWGALLSCQAKVQKAKKGKYILIGGLIALGSLLLWRILKI